MKNENTITATRGEETREFTESQWNLIGSDPENNGGWKIGTPEEANSDELATARARFTELTGEKPGRKTLEVLNQLIAEAESK
jgi:hypothetical protein